MEFFYFARRRPVDARRAARPGAYFDLTTADVASDLRKRTIHMLEAMGIPVEYSLPRGRPEPARDRPALHRRPVDGRQRHDVPAGRAGGRPRAGRVRHVHAQAARAACRARACTPTSRSSRATTNAFHDPGDPYGLSKVARASSPGCSRHAREITAVTNQFGQLLQAAHRRLRGAGLRQLGPQQPLGPRAGARHQVGQESLDPHRVPLARPGLQPLPGLLGDAGRRPQGHRARATSCRPRRRPTCSS